MAESDGVPFSTVAEALSRYVRGRLVDEWLREHQQELGAFDEIELRVVASEAGVPYLPPSRDRGQVLSSDPDDQSAGEPV